MACHVKYDNIIFSIQKVSRLNNIVTYVFSGNDDNIVTNILKKLERRENINKDEVRLLKNKFPEYYIEWINLIKKKQKVVFIPNKIHIDDSISEIRKKIFVYLSDPENKIYILPENQELWIENMNGTKEIIGYFYEDNKSNKIVVSPHIYKEFKYDDINNNIFFNTEKKINTSENSWLIYDLIDLNNPKKNIIYLSDAKEEELYLKSKQINVNKNLIDRYFKKYWHYINLSYNLEEIKNSYLLLKEYYSTENYIFNLINDIPKDKEMFGSCNILTVKLSINPDNQSLNNNENIEETYVDLYPIFDYIREKKIGDKTPFMRYSEEILDAPFTIISKEALNKNILTKNKLKTWLGIKKKEVEQRKMNGILVNRYLKDYNDEPGFSSILIKRSGNITLNVSFKGETNASFSDIEYTVKDCKKFIEDINKNRIIKKINEKQLINPPDLTIKDNEIIFKKNTKLMFMNIIIPLKLNTSFDFKKLMDFSKKFPYFLSEVKKDEDKTDKTEKSIDLKYKRVSAFANMNKILEKIDILKQHDEKDIIILKILEKEFHKSVDELKGYLLEWKKKYSSSKTKKIDAQYRRGFLTTISNNSIIIHGITNIYHIPLVYNFYVTFITLFINYEQYTKDKKFKNYFMIKNLNSHTKYFENSYEINKNANLEIDNVYEANYNYNNELVLEDEIDFSEQEEEISDVVKTHNYEGMAKDDEIDVNIRLTCDDALPEKDTCEDFCNDQKYFLRRLQRYDNKIFKSSTDKKDKSQYSFARKCQSQTQPVILPYDPETNTKIKKDSYSYSVKYSSEPETFQRWYICPKIWCPYCEIPIAESEMDPKSIRVRATKNEVGSIRGTCKTGICPYGDHQVFIRENNNETYNFPGFLSKSTHPKGLCLPCCFKKPQNSPKSSSYKGFKKCIGDEIENEDIKNGQIYILGKGIPIEKDRYGKLSLEVGRILKTNLETGYLGFREGYLRKGVKHERYNSFLSAICDIFSCDKNNSKIDILKLKKILTEKLNEDIFRSLYSGNLPNIFHNPKKNLTPLENYKNYLLNNNVEIDHKYLWDLLQRPNILFEDGVNIFIFENNNLICPLGENINIFYNKDRKNILLIKYRDYYEPIYHLEGDGKGAKRTCIFDYNNEEIKKIYEIASMGCVPKFDINWIDILKDNIKKYDINIDNITLDEGYDLQKTLNELLINIQNKKLDRTYIPVLQYVDTYNKVFALQLANGLYLPIKPSKLIEQLKYKVVDNIGEVIHQNKIKLSDIIKYTNEIIKKTNLKCKITHKVYDLKGTKTVIALVNEFNRFIPINKTVDNDKSLKISKLNYYSDIDSALFDNIKNLDRRVEQINKKNFEDETYTRMRFELSKFIQMKENKKYSDSILEIINSSDKNITKNRLKIYEILDVIYNKIVNIGKLNIDLYDYKTPNKRIPCFLRKTGKKSNEDINFLCDDDPHCITIKNSCKLFINEKNLLDINKKFNNYNYYLSKIVDELLRFKMKRTEILNDNITNIINKEIVEENPNKYIIIHTLNYNDINNTIEKLFLDNKGLFIDDRNLYEEISTKEIAFKKEKYMKSDIYLLENSKLEDLPGHWEKILTNKFKVVVSDDNNIFSLITFILNIEYNGNEEVNIQFVKNKIAQYVKYLITKKNSENTEDSMIELYKKYGDKLFKYVTTFSSLLEEILNENYVGSEADLQFICDIYKLNIIILDKRIKKNSIGYKIYKPYNLKSNNYILIYKSIIFDNSIYNLIQSKNKYIFQINELPQKFVKNIIMNNN